VALIAAMLDVGLHSSMCHFATWTVKKKSPHTPQNIRYSPRNRHARVPHAILNLRVIRPLDARLRGNILLGKVFLIPQS
jgi:hypothetical protein